ncbi:MAG: biotin--[acetyl-CoA-carboxylase] ligase [Planctomycetota bacterium]|jgi:BirA family biotin operon repressor/biotin-[acetyl-CoA-carboxylase] ligase
MADSPLDIDRLLSETFVARVEHHPTLDSTSDRARQCAADVAGELPLLVVADRQTAGRGRGNRRWWTGPGSLAFTLLLHPAFPPAGHRHALPNGPSVDQPGQSPLVALAAALAVVETVTPLVPSRRVGIDWPNDVLVSGRKLAGVLVEVLPDRRRIVGIGLNTNSPLADAPPELRQTATTLLELSGVAHDQTTILVSLLQRLEDELGQLASDPGQIATRADAFCLQHGKMLTLRLGDRPVTGRCAGIAPDGALLLETPDGRRAFYGGTLK